jgi:hypothetical protein
MDMTRTGDATIAAPARLAPISKELEGTWEGTLEVEGMRFRLALTMTNHPGGATAKMANLDQGELEVPVSGLAQTASGITLELEAIGGSYTATLNKEGTELSGTYEQGTVSAPLVFRRAGGEQK